MLRVAILRLLESYFRHRWLYLLPIVIALVAGGFYAVSLPAEYYASGKLYVEKTSLLASLTSTTSDGSWWMSPAQLTVDEFNELMATDAFMRSLVKNTKIEQQISDTSSPAQLGDIFTELRKSLKAEVRGDKLVEVSATSNDPELAYQLVTATMDAYVQWKINNDHNESVVAQSFFKDLIEPYKKELETARANLLAYLSAHEQPLGRERPTQEQIEVDRLQKEVERAEERVQSAQQNEESAQLALKKSESIVNQTYLSIDQPEIPQASALSIKKLGRDVAIFAGVGIVLTVLGIVLGALVDRSLRFSLDVEHTLGLRVLAMLPTSTGVITAEQAVIAEQPAAEASSNVQTESSVFQPQV